MSRKKNYTFRLDEEVVREFKRIAFQIGKSLNKHLEGIIDNANKSVRIKLKK